MNLLIVNLIFNLKDHRVILKKAFPDIITIKTQDSIANRLILYIEEFEVDVTTQSFVKNMPNNINIDKTIRTKIDSMVLHLAQVNLNL